MKVEPTSFSLNTKSLPGGIKDTSCKGDELQFPFEFSYFT